MMVVGVRAVGPAIGVGPEAELEIEAARGRLVADEAEHLEVAVALGVGERHGAHVVAGNANQERIGEIEIVARYIAGGSRSRGRGRG